MDEDHPLTGPDLGNDARTVRQFPDDEIPEIAEEDRRAVIQYFADMLSGKCPICHQVVEREEQRGRCVYGVPCGCRMFQGRAKKQ